MTDRRTARMAHGIAHVSRRFEGAADRYVEGAWRYLSAPLTDLCRDPEGPRERQLLLGAAFCELLHRDGWSYGFDASGYCGWVPRAALAKAEAEAPTHWVAAPATHLYPAPDIKTRERAALSLGARVRVLETEGPFVRTPAGYLPARHLRALGDWAQDPVAIAHLFLGTPYLWGGNSRAGIDCSGLVQAAWHACGRTCPGDSDQQAAMGGTRIAQGHEAAGDLVFWHGHVGLISAPGRIIHANAYHMAVSEEALSAVNDRAAAEPVILRSEALQPGERR